MHRLSSSELLAARTRVAELAQAVLDGRLGVVAGSREIAWLRLDVDPEQEDADLLTIAGIESQTDHLPLGEVRRLWDETALRAKDAELADHEAFFREDAFACCRALVERYSQAA